ncbi:MAG: nicotinate-nucleotide adenylyltransferase [Planctomycetaceae bacterium]
MSIEPSQWFQWTEGDGSMRVGIFGGSFDPIHFGHLWMAELSREAMQLDEVLFIPAATSPLKPHGPVASNEQRVAMLQLALSGYAPMRIDTREIDRGGTSYTIDTVRSLQSERPGDEFFLLVGSDAFRSIDRWKEPQELLSIITPVVLSRGGDLQMDWTSVDALAGPSRASEIRAAAIQLPLIEVSSVELRNRVREGRSIRFRVPRPVEAFIEAEKIYQIHG